VDATVIIPSLGRVKLALQLAKRLAELNPAPQNVVFVFQREEDFVGWTQAKDDSGSNALQSPDIGAAAARNFGAMVATTKYLVFLDDDCVPIAGDWLRRITEPIQSDRKLLVTGPVLGWHTASTLFSRSRRAFMLAPPFLSPWGNPESNHSAPCMTVAGGNFAIDRDFFVAIGGFSDAFTSPSMFEETELSRRAVAFGGKIYYTSRAPVRHNQESSGGMRLNVATPSDAFLLDQKRILLTLVYGHNWRTSARITMFRIVKSLVATWRKLRLNQLGMFKSDRKHRKT